MREVLATIVPGRQERQRNKMVIGMFLKRLNAQLMDAKAILGGSGAKDTWLAGNHDIDIFVLYPLQQYKDKSSELSDILHPALKKSFPGTKILRLHGSRDYFQVSFQRCTFEIIPIFHINRAEEAKNITDVSPLHAKWVQQNVKDKNQVRLAKQFLRANKLYGAESYIQGFSGYVVEILLARYGTLESFLQAAQRWGVKEIIDIANHYPKKDALFHLNASKTQSPLIVVDPVDKARNAAAALSEEKFFLLKEKAREYLKKPSPGFFKEKKLDYAAVKTLAEEKKQNLVYIEVTPLAGKKDVVGVKLLQVFRFLEKRLQPFSLAAAGWEGTLIYLLAKKRELPKHELREGPPLKLEQFVRKFRKKHKTTFIKNGRVCASVPVEHPTLAGAVKAAVQEKYVTRRIKRVKKVIVL